MTERGTALPSAAAPAPAAPAANAELVRRLEKIIEDLLWARKQEAEGVMAFANSDDTMHEDCIRRLREAAAALSAQGVSEDNHLSLDTDRQVFFYEQNHYYLSNFSAFKVGFSGRWFDTAEQAYHFQRFASVKDQNNIIDAKSAHDAFRYAQDNKSRQIDGWDELKVPIMRDILRAKARQNEYVRRKLLQTGGRELIENSWRDAYWGWGENRDGQNMLGKLWMQVRHELRLDAARKGEGR